MIPRGTARVVLPIILLSAGIAAAQPPSLPAPAPASPRPAIGLALGGGAARGIAAIGLLRWFEEHRLPIDYIAGTSMGGLIGGAYASGLTSDEIYALLKAVDWDLMFLSDSPFRYKTFRRKEDARAFPGQIDFGLKDGFKLPSGVNSGQQIELLLDRIALPYYEMRDFDELPTPFRCVATDIRSGEPLVLRSGSLARALRATMAIPAVFTPVVIDGHLLVDGGVTNNVPADVVKAMGADLVIAVSVSSSTDPDAQPTTLFGVLDQTLDSVIAKGTRQALTAADVIIVPDLKGLSGGDWRRVDDLVARGYQAAAAMSAELLRHQIDGEAYAAWLQARAARRRTTTPTIRSVSVEGVADKEATAIVRFLQGRHLGRPPAANEVEESINRISGSDRYEVIDYTLRAGTGGSELVVRATPKSYGPPFLLPAIDVQNVDSSTFALGLRARLALYDTWIPNSETRFDVGAGTNQLVALEIAKRLGDGGLFIAPRAYFHRRRLNEYGDGILLAEYRVKRTGAGVDIGYPVGGTRSELRVGYDEAAVRARLRVGVRSLPDVSGTDRVASLRWTFDGQNSPLVPSRGLHLRSAFRYHFDTPAIVDTETVLEHPRDVPQVEAVGSWFTRAGPRHRLFVSGGAGTSFDRDAGFNQFRLGGPLRLGSLHSDALRGNHYVLGVAGMLYEWFRLPDVLGSNAYVGGWIEQGSAHNAWRDAEYRASLSAAIILETLLGPAFVGYSQSLTGSGGRFYLALGPFLR